VAGAAFHSTLRHANVSVYRKVAASASREAEFDGVFVLRTNTDLAPIDAMLCYKQLTMGEQTFRTAKSLFATPGAFSDPRSWPTRNDDLRTEHNVARSFGGSPRKADD
jgi:hypothetical protein